MLEASEILEDRTLLSRSDLVAVGPMPHGDPTDVDEPVFSFDTSPRWQSVDQLAFRSGVTQQSLQPERYAAFSLDTNALRAATSAAPLPSARGTDSSTVLNLPTPDGSFARFAVWESPVMSPALAAEFPEIKTYAGQGLDDAAAVLRFDITPAGFHAQVLSPAGNYYVDPQSHLGSDTYLTYYQRDLVGDVGRFRESLVRGHVEGNADDEHFPTPDESTHDGDDTDDGLSAVDAFADSIVPVGGVGHVSSGASLRTYDIAVAATGEYTAFHGGSVSQGQAAIVTAINRVTGIYERDVAVRLQLIAGNSSLVYTDGSTDPYSNNNGVAMLTQNQTNIDNVIGSANYDVGHVFSTGGGGVAGLGVIGVNGSKARGVTGLGSPTGDAFYVDYVAHELGHQFGGNHTFNGDSDNCAGGNRNGGTAYEPGSGSTIMAYAGICGDDDLQSNSDAYFHAASYDEIVALTTSGAANSAATITATGNNIPTVNAGSDYTIPAQTPFTLTASASDADPGDSLTYVWEERDLGAQQDVNGGDNGSSPLFRSFTPTTDPTRTFPRLSDLLNNTTVIGETLPTTSRNLDFRVTVRDNRANGGGVNHDESRVTVVNTGAAFAVTSPNTAVSFAGGSTQTVTWNVAGTTANGINTANVNILLTTDGGSTFSTLVGNVPNDGSQAVTIPNTATSTARIKVQGAGNIFFDVSNTNFTITQSAGGANIAKVRVRLPGSEYLQLAEVQVFDVNGINVATSGTATQSSTLTGSVAVASRAIDGNTNQDYAGASMSVTNFQAQPFWFVTFASLVEIGSIKVFNRSDGSGNRLENAVVETLNASDTVVFTGTISGAVDGSIHRFQVATVNDTTAPTADLSSPTNGGSIGLQALNNRDYIDVTFSDTGGSDLNTATINGGEFTLGGSGLGTASLVGGAPALVSGSTYRYATTGDFVAGTVTVSFVGSTWQDGSGNNNAVETESFTIADARQDIRKVRVRLPGSNYLQLAEVQVFDINGTNVALSGTATQSSTLTGSGAVASRAIDGNTNQDYSGSSMSVTNFEAQPFWLVTFASAVEVGSIKLFNRSDGSGDRLAHAVVETLDSGDGVVFTGTVTGAVNGSTHRFQVATVTDTTAPTADLSSPTNGGSIGLQAINNRDYIDVTFNDAGGSDLNTATINGGEFTLGGSGLGSAALVGGAPTLVSGSTYRYGTSGDFSSGTVTVIFVANTWQDGSGNNNAAETESFTIADASQDIRKVRVRLPGSNYLQLAEVQVFDTNGTNVALSGTATQSSTLTGSGAVASRAIDGNTNQAYAGASMSVTNFDAQPFWLVTFASAVEVGSIKLFNRSDGSGERLANAIVETLDSGDGVVFTGTVTGAVNGSTHRFQVASVTDTTAPTADLSSPTNGSTIGLQTLNNRDYIAVTFNDAGGSDLNTATINGGEFTLSGAGLGTAALVGGAPTLVSGSTYRYATTGDFVAGTVNVSFVVNTWQDGSGNNNAAEAESFTVADASQDIRKVRVRLPGSNYLQLAEVQVFDINGTNVAPSGTATQSSTLTGSGAVASRAIDGNTNQDYAGSSMSVTNLEAQPFWFVSFASAIEVSSIKVFNRSDGSGDRLSNAIVETLDSGDNAVFSQTITGAVDGSIHTFTLVTVPELTVTIAAASISENGGSTTATVTRGGSTAAAVSVTPTSSDTNEATVTTPLNFGIGESSKVTTINGVDDLVADGTKTVTITATASGYSAGSDTLNVLDDEATAFTIDVIFIDSSLTTSQQAVFTTAANRWAAIITGDVPDVTVPGSFFTDGIQRFVDDVAIEASAPFIDGVGNILGSAGPTGVRTTSRIPAVGQMQFDSADVASLESSGQLQNVILHEMGHVLGIGTIWTDLGFLTGAGGADPRFTGTGATVQYNTVFGNSESSVPVANTGGSGTRDSHWRESVFANELMTGYLNSGTNPISVVTVAMLADLGYAVNLNAADAYSPPSLRSAGGNSGATGTGGASLVAAPDFDDGSDQHSAQAPHAFVPAWRFIDEPLVIDDLHRAGPIPAIWFDGSAVTDQLLVSLDFGVAGAFWNRQRLPLNPQLTPRLNAILRLEQIGRESTLVDDAEREAEPTKQFEQNWTIDNFFGDRNNNLWGLAWG
ncbi:MAG: M12 family metallo-peptidase [Planctomycetota bacterium]|nr:M12 family metallo-peptidase [Planctomycetota bacterium]